jgi:hypothetical protein
MLRLVAIVLTVELAAFAGEAAAGAAGHGTLNIGIRIAAAGEAPSAYQRFESSLDTAMRSGTRPLDWALAATVNAKPERTIGAASPNVDGDLFRAAQAAPNDPLVQWLVANRADTSTPEGAAHRTAAVDALTRIESDNGANWMEALVDAEKRGDANGTDDALTRMAESRRFDDHFVGVVHAWLDAYDRHPPPPGISTDNYSAGFVVAFAKAAATALPAYQGIVRVCKPPAADGAAFERAGRCATVGRTMLHHGTTMIAQSIGFAILRELDVANDDDRAANRNVEWYRANALSGTGYESNPRDALAYESDWRRMDDEIDVARSALHRAGLPTEAPSGWTSPYATRAGP